MKKELITKESFQRMAKIDALSWCQFVKHIDIWKCLCDSKFSERKKFAKWFANTVKLSALDGMEYNKLRDETCLKIINIWKKNKIPKNSMRNDKQIYWLYNLSEVKILNSVVVLYCLLFQLNKTGQNRRFF